MLIPSKNVFVPSLAENMAWHSARHVTTSVNHRSANKVTILHTSLKFQGTE